MNRRTRIRTTAAFTAGVLGLAVGGCALRPDPPADAESRPPSVTRTSPDDRRATTTAAPRPPALPIAEAIGQMVLARFSGPEPPAALLAQIRAGHVGGVTLFGDNVPGDRRQVRALTDTLQAAARNGGRPPLLIAVDQEGGRVQRIADPRQPAAAEMTTAAIAREQGRIAGRTLRTRGITLDLAPIADVADAAHGDGILGDRAFGSDPAVVAERACAFTAGLADAGVGAVLKHFPGLGTARLDTDERPSTIDRSADRLRRDYAAYRRCGRDETVAVMLSSAIYPRLLGPEPAVLTERTYSRELAAAAGRPLTVSDALDTPAFADEPAPARRAVLAGVDLLLHSGADRSAAVHASLLADVRSGRIPAARVQDAATRIVAFKRRLGR